MPLYEIGVMVTPSVHMVVICPCVGLWDCKITVDAYRITFGDWNPDSWEQSLSVTWLVAVEGVGVGVGDELVVGVG